MSCLSSQTALSLISSEASTEVSVTGKRAWSSGFLATQERWQR